MKLQKIALYKKQTKENKNEMKKKDICWCRDNFARDISSCEPYVNKTKIQ